MRLLLVSGSARSLLNFLGPLMKALVARGHAVVACATEATPETVQKLSALGVRFSHSPIVRHGLSPIGDLQALMALRKLMKQERPERVLAYTVKPVIYAHLAARLAGRPMVFAWIPGLGYAFGNGSLKQKFVGFVVRNLYRLALKQSCGVIFQNPDDQALFSEQGLLPRQVPAIMTNGQGVDLEWFTPQPLPEEPVFLLVARLLAEKGVREFYQAACLIKEKYPQARLQVVGGLDPNPASIQAAELQQWRSTGVIEYLGQLDGCRPAYAGARVFVLPSYYREGVPRSSMEAMAMGRPVITTDAPGCRETVVEGKNGFLVPVRDPKGLATAMERFILEPELAEQMGKESLRIAREKYDVHKVNKVIMDSMSV